MSSPHIIIIGGGVGGLALAQNLKKRGISFTLFERDASPASRAQGYRIRVAGRGAEALRECLDNELLNLFEKTCAETKPRMSGAQLNAIDGTPIQPLLPKETYGRSISQGPPWMKRSDHSYTVDRTILRNLLLLGQEDCIKFDKMFTYYETTGTGITAYFSDGTSEQGSLLVGADGTTSVFRKQLLPKIRYVDTGSRVIYGKTQLTAELIARFPANAMDWRTKIQDQRLLTLFMDPIRFPNDAAVVSNGRLPRTDDYVFWVFGGSAEAFGVSDIEFHNLSAKAAADLTLKLTTSWDPSFRSMFELQDTAQSAPLRLISAKPEHPEWTPSGNVILMGDAIHAMMPAGGSGANTALADASLLAEIIAKKGISKETMGSFVDQMWEYALPAINGSAEGGKELLGFKGFENAKEVIF
jgi:2-polyprenyl-6-methoxyphenol hydroxylase-like FAD-dependent oxidoreductase